VPLSPLKEKENFASFNEQYLDAMDFDIGAEIDVELLTGIY
jgi:hypothetical protein